MKEVFFRNFCCLIKAFDTVDHEKIILKLEKYGICGKNLLCFKSYLSNRKQYIEYRDDFHRQKYTNLLQLKCELVSKDLSSIMLADDTNLFHSHRSIKILFKHENGEQEQTSQWFKANKLSLNEGKTKFILFHKPLDNDKLPP